MERQIASLDLSKTTIAQLKGKGYNYLSDFEQNINKISNLDNVSLQKAPETIPAFDIYKEELINGCILSYDENLDCILKDVIIPKTINELTGDSGCGKTQLCFQLCISVQLPKWCGGIEGEALYISTNSNFARQRVTDLSKDFIRRYNHLKPSTEHSNTKFDVASILQHIHYIKICNVAELMACVKSFHNSMANKQIRLIVIDSFSFIMRMISVKDRKALVNKIFCDLRTLGRIYNLTVVITNDLTTRVNKRESYNTSSFGDSLFHLVNSRILLCKRNGCFYANLEKNIIHDQKDTSFYF